MELVDTHCHLTALDEKAQNRAIAFAAENHVRKLLCIGASSGIDTAREAVAWAEKYDNVWATIGVHPHDAGTYSSLDEIEALASHPKVVAIGETGLDFFRDWAPKEKQLELFRNSIELAKKHRKPLVIHCRDAEEETIAVLRECGADSVGGVFHCYAGSAEFAERAYELNFIVSFTGVVTFKSATALRETVRRIPLERMMLETDCPYMAPEPFRGLPSEPAHVYQIAQKIAEIKGLPLEEVARVTTQNANKLFGFYTSGHS